MFLNQRERTVYYTAQQVATDGDINFEDSGDSLGSDCPNKTTESSTVNDRLSGGGGGGRCLFVKTSFRGGGLLDSGGLIDHLW